MQKIQVRQEIGLVAVIIEKFYFQGSYTYEVEGLANSKIMLWAHTFDKKINGSALPIILRSSIDEFPDSEIQFMLTVNDPILKVGMKIVENLRIISPSRSS